MQLLSRSLENVVVVVVVVVVAAVTVYDGSVLQSCCSRNT